MMALEREIWFKCTDMYSVDIVSIDKKLMDIRCQESRRIFVKPRGRKGRLDALPFQVSSSSQPVSDPTGTTVVRTDLYIWCLLSHKDSPLPRIETKGSNLKDGAEAFESYLV